MWCSTACSYADRTGRAARLGKRGDGCRVKLPKFRKLLRLATARVLVGRMTALADGADDAATKYSSSWRGIERLDVRLALRSASALRVRSASLSTTSMCVVAETREDNERRGMELQITTVFLPPNTPSKTWINTTQHRLGRERRRRDRQKSYTDENRLYVAGCGAVQLPVASVLVDRLEIGAAPTGDQLRNERANEGRRGSTAKGERAKLQSQTSIRNQNCKTLESLEKNSIRQQKRVSDWTEGSMDHDAGQ